MQKKAERRRKRQEIRSAQHIAAQAREPTPPDYEEEEELPPGEPTGHYGAQQAREKDQRQRYDRGDPGTPPPRQHQSSFSAGHGECFVSNSVIFECLKSSVQPLEVLMYNN